MNNIYVHCGSKKFDINKFIKIHNIEGFVKPIGGLWASPASSNDWYNWCKSNNFRIKKYSNSKFQFKLADGTRLLYINDSKQLNNLPTTENEFLRFGFVALDFEKLSEIYDAIYVEFSADFNLYEKLCGWDVDSLLVMNPHIIQEIACN